MPLRCDRSFYHLGFNGKFRNLKQSSILYATEMANMVAQYLLVSAKLARLLFDEQIIPL